MRFMILLFVFSLFSTPLIQANQIGDIHLYCKPKFRVYLDGELIGKTNKSDSGLFITDVPLGLHKIRLMKKRKANEVLTFSVNRALLEIESKKYNVGKFSEYVRNSKLIEEGSGIIPVIASIEGAPAGLRYYLNLKPEVSDLYIPGIDEKYDVDTLPIMIEMVTPAFLVRDITPQLEHDEVWVKGLIGPKGNVDSVVVIGSCGDSTFDNLAHGAALETKFKPAVKDSKNSWVWVCWAIPCVMADAEKLLNDAMSYTNPQPIEKIETANEYLPSPDEFVPVEILPEMIHQKYPTYPKEAKEKKKEGTVWVKALVDKNGDVVKAQVGKSSGVELLDNAAVEVATQNKFKPAIQNGRPIAVWVTYKVDFKLNE